MDEHAFPPTGFAVARLGCSLQKHVREMYTPLNPTFIYVVKLGYTGACLIFLVLIQSIHCGNSYEYPQCNIKNTCTTFFPVKFTIFASEENLCILQGQVFVMCVTVNHVIKRLMCMLFCSG